MPEKVLSEITKRQFNGINWLRLESTYIPITALQKCITQEREFLKTTVKPKAGMKMLPMEGINTLTMRLVKCTIQAPVRNRIMKKQ